MFEEGARLRQIHGEEKVFDFTLGNPSVEPPEAFHRELLSLAQNPVPGMHRYMNNAGYEETRAAVAEVLAESSPQPVEARHVVMTCGAGGALNVALKTILNPGEEVIILAPFFVEYKFYVDNHGGVTGRSGPNRETFQLDIAAIEAGDRTQHPGRHHQFSQQPDRRHLSGREPAGPGRDARAKEKEFERQIYVISDEPYARLAYDGRARPGGSSHCVKNSLVVTSHSKDLALPGERIGYLAANPAMNEVDQFMEGAIFCNRVLGFVNAPALMQRLVAELQRESVDIAEYQDKRDLLYDHLSALGFQMVKPGGGFYLFPASPLPDDIEFVRLAQKHNILLVPGTGFGAPGYFRIAYCVDESIIRRSLPAWEKLAQRRRGCKSRLKIQDYSCTSNL